MPTLEEIAARAHPSQKKGRSLSEIAGPGAMTVPPIDPLTGRAKTAGRTMTQGETYDYALETLPTAAALVATIPMSAPTAAGLGVGALIRAAATRAGVAGLGGLTGSLLKSGAQTALDTPGAPKSKADVINRAIEDTMMQGAMQVGGEIPGVVAPAIAKGASKFVASLPRTKGGLQYLRGKWDEIKLAADAKRVTADQTAAAVVDDFRAAIAPHEIGEIPREAASIFRQRFTEAERTGYEKMEEALAGTKIDYRDVADRIVALEAKRPKARGGLSVATEPEAEWAKLVEAMKAGQTVKGDASLMTLKPAKNAIEAGNAVIRARSAISQRLWDAKHGKVNMAEGHTKEYVAGLEDLLKSLDQKIIGAANGIDPLLGEGYRALLDFSGSHRQVMKSAIFKMAEENKGDIAKVLLSSRHPENVDIFMELVRGGKMPAEDLAAVQRAGVESMLLRSGKGGEKVLDLESFATRLSQTGDAGKRLYADPKSKAMVENLRTLSREVKSLPRHPADVGMDLAEANEGRMAELFASAAGYKYTKTVFLPAAAMRAATQFLMKVADNPNDWKKFHAVWREYQRGSMAGPAAAKHLTNLLRGGQVAAGVAPLASDLLAPSH